jgi:putative ABC transport system permease protein
MSTMLQDVRYALRLLVRSPGFTLLATLTIGLGIGVNATIFSSVNALLLRPFPYEDQARVVAIRSLNARYGSDANELSYPDFQDVRAQSRSFTSAAAYTGRSYNLASSEEEPERIEGEAVSATLFPLLGVSPSLGRNFLPEEDRPGAAKVAMLSHALWQRRFAGDSGVVGRTVLMNGEPHTVVGVMPPRFEFPADAKIWSPLALDPDSLRGSHYLEAVGRLAPGVTIAQADAELRAIARRLEQQYPETNKSWSMNVVPLREHEIGEYRPVLYIMQGAVLLVMLIACANVANLLLARASSRSREIAVRTAIGAARTRIVRQLLTESVILALAGSAVGILFATWGNAFVDSAVPADRPFWMTFEIDWRVLTFTIALAIVTGLIFGLAPALQASSTDLNETLKEGGRTGTSARRNRLRGVLVVSEVALSLVLLIGAALMIESFVRLQQVDPGYDRDNVLLQRVYLAGKAYDSTYARAAFFDEVIERVKALPGIGAAAATTNTPLSGSSTASTIVIEGRSYDPGEEPAASWRSTTAEYFDVFRIPIVRGRAYTADEVRDTADVVVVSEAMARRHWPNESALGKRFRFASDDDGERWFTVIGVTPDVKHRQLNERPQAQFYLPYTQSAWRGVTIAVRTAGSPLSLAGAVRQAIHAADPNLPVFDVVTADDEFRQSVWEPRFFGQLFAGFAVIALVLAVSGIYGVMAYMVTQRTHEIGVRLALGAPRREVLTMVVTRGAVLAVGGIAIGLVGAFGLTRVLSSMLFGVGATDAVTFVVIALLLGVVAIVASYIPALRASRVDPMVALRYE